jgi:type I restriction enzyme S subunit
VSWLPKNWIVTELFNVAAWGSGGTPSRANSSYYGGNIPWVKTGELGQRYVLDTEEKITEAGVENSSAKMFRKGSVAVAMYGATIGKTSILGIDATTNQACGVGMPFDGVTSSEYLYYYLSSQKEDFIEAGKGGAQPNISQTVIKSWPIPLAPFTEQKRIVDKLDTVLARVDACRERLNRAPLILKRFKQSVLAAATSGKLTEDWRAEQMRDFDWSDESLSSIGIVSGGLTKNSKRDILPQQRPYLRVANVYANLLKLDGNPPSK